MLKVGFFFSYKKLQGVFTRELVFLRTMLFDLGDKDRKQKNTAERCSLFPEIESILSSSILFLFFKFFLSDGRVNIFLNKQKTKFCKQEGPTQGPSKQNGKPIESAGPSWLAGWVASHSCGHSFSNCVAKIL